MPFSAYGIPDFVANTYFPSEDGAVFGPHLKTGLPEMNGSFSPVTVIPKLHSSGFLTNARDFPARMEP